MSPEQAAWLAGFFDGEGCLASYTAGRHRKSNAAKWLVTNTNLASLERCRAFTGVGSIRLQKSLPHHRPKWVWEVNGKRNIKSLCEQLMPYLVIKDEVCQAFLDNYTEGRAKVAA